MCGEIENYFSTVNNSSKLFEQSKKWEIIEKQVTETIIQNLEQPLGGNRGSFKPAEKVLSVQDFMDFASIEHKKHS